MPTPKLSPQLRRSARNINIKTLVKAENSDHHRQGLMFTADPVKRSRSYSSTKAESLSPVPKKVKLEPATSTRQPSPTKSGRRVKVKDEVAKVGNGVLETVAMTKAEVLKDRKLKSFSAFSRTSPFPDFLRPTHEECKVAHSILARIHGERHRPVAVVAPTTSAGCGDSPTVLDALVRTILSQNTSNKNSTRAKLSMDKEYGGSAKWEAIVRGGQARLQKSIQSGGLATIKSKVIMSLLNQTMDRYGVYSLDHLFQASDEDAMKEMLSFQGVGPKTASCVLLFCLQRPSFAVDTHVYRIAGLLGWRPATAGREETQAHLNAVVADEEKYPLHLLLVTHGRYCQECKAGGKSVGKCELRKVFKGGRFTGGVQKEYLMKKEQEVKEEFKDEIKEEGVKEEYEEMVQDNEGEEEGEEEGEADNDEAIKKEED
ncbi:hypothetical protein E4U21_006927 [Claviceps maximensis]|nr:hypothetical protein E4U21_006927 [Claviceps maximensis]